MNGESKLAFVLPRNSTRSSIYPSPYCNPRVYSLMITNMIMKRAQAHTKLDWGRIRILLFLGESKFDAIASPCKITPCLVHTHTVVISNKSKHEVRVPWEVKPYSPEFLIWRSQAFLFRNLHQEDTKDNRFWHLLAQWRISRHQGRGFSHTFVDTHSACKKREMKGVTHLILSGILLCTSDKIFSPFI